MKRLLLASVLFATLSNASAQDTKQDVFVNGDAAAGAARAATCFACHGPNGNGAINPEWPKLSAQGSRYIYGQLKDFKTAARKNPVMMGQAAALSDEDMRNLASFFAAQAPVPGVASKDAVKVAQLLYRGGDASRGLPACAACHSPEGLGNAAAAYPRLSGQNSGYVINQLKAYASGERGATPKGQIMQSIASKLTSDEISALASYVSGLQ
jgi:cytochrome c553